MASEETAPLTTESPPAPITAVQPHSQPHIEADPDDNADADSTLGSLGGSATTSIGSSVLKYREENGRTYHAYKDGKYLYPNTEQESDRLDLQHHMWLLTLDGKLFLSPIGENIAGRVLDVGTGTGIWAIDFADEHPESQVLGVDLSPIQPSFIPPNLVFEIDDVEAEWTYGTKFKFIHARFMSGSLSDWPAFMKHVFDNLEPGGYFELQEFTSPRCDDGSAAADSPLAKWRIFMEDAASRVGRPLNILWQLKSMMEEAGFEAVVQKEYLWPQNPWPKDPKLKELGQWNLENISGGLEDLSIALFTRVLGWSKAEVEAFLPGVRKDLKDRSKHNYNPIFVIYGRKPEAAV